MPLSGVNDELCHSQRAPFTYSESESLSDLSLKAVSLQGDDSEFVEAIEGFVGEKSLRVELGLLPASEGIEG